MGVRILTGDCRVVLPTLPDASVQCCVTSPPYFCLRSYGIGAENGEMGSEPSLDAYIAEMVAVFREVRRVLRADGTLWLNLGDSYAANRTYQVPDSKHVDVGNGSGSRVPDSLKPKDLMMVPARVALALQADGWWLRSDIIWMKPNPMPESVTDRPTSAHEHVYLLTKSARYFYDAEAVREDAVKVGTPGHLQGGMGARAGTREGLRGTQWLQESGRNVRNVWEIATAPFPEAHFATFPPELAARCIKAGTRPGDTALDPFAGAGTVAVVAQELGRSSVGIELNPAYVEMAWARVQAGSPFERVKPTPDNHAAAGPLLALLA